MSWSIAIAGHKDKCSASCYFGHPGKERLEAVFQDVSVEEGAAKAAAFILKALQAHPEYEDEPEPEAAPVALHTVEDAPEPPKG
jgi:hypothetical protein